MKAKDFVLLSISVLILVVAIEGCGSDTFAQFALTKPGPFEGVKELERGKALSLLLRSIHSSFSQATICYWAADSTLLGLYKHGTLLPFESSAYISIRTSDYVRALLRVRDIASIQSNYEIDTNFQVKHIRVWILENGAVKIGHLDIFVFNQEAEMLMHPWKSALSVNNIFPLVKAHFQDTFLWVPAKTELFLQSIYGESFAHPAKVLDWATLKYVPSSLKKEYYPLVSIIIPTYERPQFLAKSLELISRQDYPNLEVIIVDDSKESFAGEFVVQNVKYIHLQNRITIGEKRNLAVTYATGEIIVHWDDDDFFREHRVTAQVAPILSGEVSMTVLEHHYYFYLPTRTFYVVKRASSWGPHFGTFVYHKRLWNSGLRYPDNSMAEDYAFAEEALQTGAQIRILNNEDGKHVYIRHYNTWDFNLADYDAQVVVVDRPSFFSEQDYDYYCALDVKPLSTPPKYYASDKIRWDRDELRPAWTDVATYPAYPSYKMYTLGLAAKVGIGVGVAGGVALIVLLGLAAYGYTQWKKKKEQGYIPINNTNFD